MRILTHGTPFTAQGVLCVVPRRDLLVVVCVPDYLSLFVFDFFVFQSSIALILYILPTLLPHGIPALSAMLSKHYHKTWMTILKERICLHNFESL
jgi:hypothetical protein